MKKLFTLILVLAGYVGTVSATIKTIYVENSYAMDHMYLYAFNSESDKNANWRGVELTTYVEIDGKKIFTVEIDDRFGSFIINGYKENGDFQTENLSVANDANDGSYYYIENKGDGNRIYEMTLYTYNFTTETAESYNDLEIYLFYNDKPINGDWDNAPAMSKSGNVYTYSYNSFHDAINVVFKNSSGQTEDLGASAGNNSYLLKYNDSAAKKFRLAEAVTLNGSGFATYVSSNALIVPDETAYYAEDTNDGSANAKAITNPAAGTAMLIKGNASEKCFFEIASSGSAVTNNAFKPGNGGKVLGGNGPFNYVLNGNTFYLANKTEGATVATGKAYLQLTQQAAAGARVLRFADDETQGVNAIATEKTNDGAYYNLRGQRVNTPTKGLYIQNGKKMIIK